MPPARARQLIAAAERLPASDPKVTYPSWYLHRWHFLPEGYLSRRSAAGYELFIRNFYNLGFEGRTIRAVVAEVQRLQPASVIELGCGPGRLLRAVKHASPATEAVGVDLSPFLLERAAKRLRGRGVRIAHGDGLALAADEGAFDLAIAAHYFGHLPAALRAPAVEEAARVVRPGGHLIVIDHRWHGLPATPALKRHSVSRHSAATVSLTVFQRTEQQP